MMGIIGVKFFIPLVWDIFGLWSQSLIFFPLAWDSHGMRNGGSVSVIFLMLDIWCLDGVGN